MVENDIFNLEVVKAFSIPDAWFQCIQAVLATGREYKVAEGGSMAGQFRKEFDYVTILIQCPRHRPLQIPIPHHLGLPQPSSWDGIQKYSVEYLTEPGQRPGEDYTYADRIAIQIEKVIEKHIMALREGARTNQATIAVARPEDIKLVSPPCLRTIDTSIVNGELCFHLYFRSWDLWAGLPTNLGGLQLLKEYMGNKLGVEDGPMVASSKGLHLYDYAWSFAESRTYKERIEKIDKGG